MTFDCVIIGAGLAGLSAATVFEEAGKSWVILEKDRHVGGRVSSQLVDGFICDNGFQVLLPAYPTAKKILNYQDLELMAYPKGSVIYDNQSPRWFGVPGGYHKQFKIGKSFRLTPLDYLKLATNTMFVSTPKFTNDRVDLIQYFDENFSEEASRKFLIPFFQGIFLDPNLIVAPALWKYYIRLFLQAGVAIPKYGMKKIPEQLANKLPKDKILVNKSVSSINNNVIKTSNNETYNAKHIIIATDQLAASKLLDQDIEAVQKRPVYTTFIKSKYVSQLAPLTFFPGLQPCQQLSIPTLINPSYSPDDHHLIMTTSFVKEAHDIEVLKTSLKPHLGNQVNYWELIHQHHIEYALPSTAVFPNLPNNMSICGDWIGYGSIDSAIKTGIDIAKNLI